MVHILLVILKVIGIILLVILGLILLLAALVLFVPVRYKLDGSYQGKLNGWIKVSWLLHIISFKGTAVDNGIKYRFKIFGIPLGRKKKKKRKGKKKKVKKKKQEVRKETLELSKEKQEIVKDSVTVKPEVQRQKKVINETITIEETVKQEKASVFSKIKGFFKKLKNIKYTLSRLYARMKKMRENISGFFDFIHDEENKATASLLKEEGLKLWKHAKPRKLKGTVLFGTDDPALTGQLLAVLALLYPIYKDDIRITPDFEKVMLEGTLYMRGRIRGFTILNCGLRIYKDKNIKKLIKQRL